MGRRRLTSWTFLAFVCLVAHPSPTSAQSAIVGLVKDATGAVLPGVTVEASSDVLIERSKSAVTDGDGRYIVTDLRPGTYVVTFSLVGFSTVQRGGIQLPSEFTMTLNAELKLGAVEETITVTGEAPVVDVTTAVHTAVLDRNAIDTLPTGRTIQGIGQLVVGINLNLPDTGGARAMQQTYMTTHGMSSANNTVLVDGMMVNGLQSDGSVQSYFNDAMNQEVSYQTSGIGADTQAGGVRLNMIPREGGNRFSGDFKTAYRPGDWQSKNLTARHMARGLNSGTRTDRIIDATFAEGGPIKRDNIWFFASARYYSVNNFIGGTTFDDGSQGVDDQFIKSALVRATWQITPRTKFSAYFDEVDKFRGHDMTAGVDPETASVVWHSPAYHTTAAKVTNVLSARLLVEAGWSSNLEYYTNSYQEGIEKPRFSNEWYAGASRLELAIPGFTRRAATTSQTTQSPARYAWNASISFVTGSHNFKAGVQDTWGSFYHTVDANGDLTQQYRSSVAAGGTGVAWTRADSVLVRNTPVRSGERLNYDLGIYAQDSWRLDRLTVNAGMRWEALNAQVLEGFSPAGRFSTERRFPESKNLPDWRDWAPRFALVYDVFGSSKTALKYSLSRYNASRTTGIAAQYNPLDSTTATLPWRDVNGDDIAQGERGCTTYPSAGCEIDFRGLDANFGRLSLNNYGAYPRTWNLEHGVELQHELMPRLSTSVSWFHGNFHNLTTTVNRALTHADYTPFTIYDVRNGSPITVYGLNANAVPSVRPADNLDTVDPAKKRIYNALNLEFRARPGNGAQLFGGVSFERQLDVDCTAPDDPNTLRFCDDRKNGIHFRKQLKLAGAYQLPWAITLSGVLQSTLPVPLPQTRTTRLTALQDTRNMTLVSGTTTYPTNCPGACADLTGRVIIPRTVQGQGQLIVPLVPSSTTFIERITQLDFKIQRDFRIRRVTVAPTVEVFNVNNTDAIISYQQVNILNASYESPNTIMQPRMIGIGATVRW